MSDILRLKAGETLCEKGGSSDEMYILRSGEVKVMDGDREIEVLKSIAVIGEVSFIEKIPRQNTVIANMPCTLMVISRESFDEVFSTMPDWYMALYTSVLSRLKNMGYGDIV
ncbi:MAG: cyclic nucleotide-binding domain-containing protein [Bdellovibrionales bacterium]|nr:cyclic nucleotide-binding domain-containing protein [Bdellovibrionales bacterium]